MTSPRGAEQVLDRLYGVTHLLLDPDLRVHDDQRENRENP